MKGISILCETSKVTEARFAGSQLFGTDKLLEIPLSKEGKVPATHWYCFIKLKDADYQKLLEIQKHTIIEESNPSIFLKKYGLKIIKN